jgi:hypothetical protein
MALDESLCLDFADQWGAETGLGVGPSLNGLQTSRCLDTSTGLGVHLPIALSKPQLDVCTSDFVGSGIGNTKSNKRIKVQHGLLLRATPAVYPTTSFIGLPIANSAYAMPPPFSTFSNSPIGYDPTVVLARAAPRAYASSVQHPVQGTKRR